MSCCTVMPSVSPMPININRTQSRSATWPMPPASLALAPSSSSRTFTPSISHPCATEILPRLFISDMSCAENRALLQSLGVSHVVTAMRGYVAIPSELGLKSLQVPLEDLPFSELASHLPTTTAFIHDALSRNPTACVLVHCSEGISRSVSVVCAYLIATYAWTPAYAIAFVKSKRRIADPNFGFISQLHEYSDSLRAKKQSLGSR